MSKEKNDARARRLGALAAKSIETVVVHAKREELKTFSSEETKKLIIDERYQRHELKPRVNQLITAMQRGGEVPPGDVARRPDGAYAIVDGQQRWWAAWHLNRPYTATVWIVKDLDMERELFTALNARQKLSPTEEVKSHSGPAGDFMRRLDMAADSPVAGLLFGGHYPAGTVARALYTLATGSQPPGNTQRLMHGLGLLVERDAKGMWREATLFCALVRQVWDVGTRPPPRAAVALALVARDRWSNGGPHSPPSPVAIKRLRATNWQVLLRPGGTESLPLAALRSYIGTKWK